jgi:inner membrane protein
VLLFGHAGITLGVATVLTHAIDKKRNESGWLASLSRYLDIRWLLVGSMLPDIIDKPVGLYFFRDTFNNGRIFSHTLLFLILISAGGFFLWKKYHHVWMVSLAAGTLMHLILDESWLAPATLFWPLLGLTFPKIELEYWLDNILKALFTAPKIYITELIGLIIITWCGVVIIRKKNTGNFLKYGKVN